MKEEWEVWGYMENNGGDFLFYWGKYNIVVLVNKIGVIMIFFLLLNILLFKYSYFLVVWLKFGENFKILFYVIVCFYFIFIINNFIRVVNRLYIKCISDLFFFICLIFGWDLINVWKIGGRRDLGNKEIESLVFR